MAAPRSWLLQGAQGSSFEAAADDPQKVRFQVELEFVQCLANPNYLNLIATSALLLPVLAQRGYFKDQNFINYLNYLTYWKQPEYAKYLKYPQCLYFLNLLQYELFRKELVNWQCAKFIDDQQLLHWQHYHRKRVRLISAQQERLQHALPQQQQQPSGTGLAAAGQMAIVQPSGQATDKAIGQVALQQTSLGK